MNTLSSVNANYNTLAMPGRSSAPQAACNCGSKDSVVLSGTRQRDEEPPTPPTPPAPEPPAPEPPPTPEPPPEPPPAPVTKKWTVMVYSASDCNLYRFMQSDLDEAERVGSTETMHVIAQTDHGPRNGTAQRIELVPDQTPGLKAPVKQDLGSYNMAAPEALADFVKWGMKEYPAENYMLIISDHGDGWKGAAQDWSHNGWMSTPDIEAGLKMAREETGKKIDVLGFDACLMASAEVAYQLKDEINYLVASQEVEGGAGWEYNRVLSEGTLKSLDQKLSATRFNMDPKQVATHVVICAQGNQDDLPTMSAIETAKMPAVKRALDNFADAMATSQVSKDTFTTAAENTQGFYDYKDLSDFANQVKTGVQAQDCYLAGAADRLMAAVSNAVVAEQHSDNYPGAKGMSIELHNTSSSDYANLKLSQDTQWDEAVAQMHS
ncbi:MAG: hypothetical protein AMXMBFR33_24790 [Candidatus Xenobia bacterium]